MPTIRFLHDNGFQSYMSPGRFFWFDIYGLTLEFDDKTQAWRFDESNHVMCSIDDLASAFYEITGRDLEPAGNPITREAIWKENTMRQQHLVQTEFTKNPGTNGPGFQNLK